MAHPGLVFKPVFLKNQKIEKYLNEVLGIEVRYSLSIVVDKLHLVAQMLLELALSDLSFCKSMLNKIEKFCLHVKISFNVFVRLFWLVYRGYIVIGEPACEFVGTCVFPEGRVPAHL